MRENSKDSVAGISAKTQQCKRVYYGRIIESPRCKVFSFLVCVNSGNKRNSIDCLTQPSLDTMKILGWFWFTIHTHYYWTYGMVTFCGQWLFVSTEIHQNCLWEFTYFVLISSPFMSTNILQLESPFENKLRIGDKREMEFDKTTLYVRWIDFFQDSTFWKRKTLHNILKWILTSQNK